MIKKELQKTEHFPGAINQYPSRDDSRLQKEKKTQILKKETNAYTYLAVNSNWKLS